MSNKVEIRRMRSQLRTWELEDEAGFPHSTPFFYEDTNDHLMEMKLTAVVCQRKRNVVAVIAFMLISVLFAAVVFFITMVGVPIVVGPMLVIGMAAVSVCARVHAHTLQADQFAAIKVMDAKMDEIEHRTVLAKAKASDSSTWMRGALGKSEYPKDVRYMAPRQRQLTSYPDTLEGRAAAIKQAKEIQHQIAVKAKAEYAERVTSKRPVIHVPPKRS